MEDFVEPVTLTVIASVAAALAGYFAGRYNKATGRIRSASAWSDQRVSEPAIDETESCLQIAREYASDLLKIFDDPDGTLRAQLAKFTEEYLARLDAQYDMLEEALKDLDALIARSNEAAPKPVHDPGPEPPVKRNAKRQLTPKQEQRLREWKRARKAYDAYYSEYAGWNQSYEYAQLQKTMDIREKLRVEFERCDSAFENALVFLDHLRAEGYRVKSLSLQDNDVEAQVEVMQVKAQIEEELKQLSDSHSASQQSVERSGYAQIIHLRKNAQKA